MCVIYCGDFFIWIPVLSEQFQIEFSRWAKTEQVDIRVESFYFSINKAPFKITRADWLNFSKFPESNMIVIN